ncbi:MAG: TSUP family transporter [Chromatiales bacterium]|nr:TSUP family transporter [Chromatiales bacterium]
MSGTTSHPTGNPARRRADRPRPRYFIRGISGFGSGLIAVPLLAHFLPLTFVVPMILVTDCHGLAGARHTYPHSTRAGTRCGRLCPSAFSACWPAPPCWSTCRYAPLLATLGVFVLLFGMRSVLNLHGTRTRLAAGGAAPAGLIGGTIGALFGAGGPPYVIYLNHRLHDKG